jgi:hypothetical protein
VLSTFPSPTIDFVIPETVPVKVGDDIVEYVLEAELCVKYVELAVDSNKYPDRSVLEEASSTQSFPSFTYAFLAIIIPPL